MPYVVQKKDIQMKSKKTIIIVLAILIQIITTYQGNAQQNLKKIEKAKATAISELQKQLSKMPKGSEGDYGFNNREEFSEAQIEEFILLENILHNDQIKFTRYRFLISVNNEPRALISYSEKDSLYMMSGLGANKLASEVHKKKKSYKSDMRVAKLMRVNNKYFKGDFIQFFSSFKKGLPEEGWIPMKSTKLFYGHQKKKTIKSSYTLKELKNIGTTQKWNTKH